MKKHLLILLALALNVGCANVTVTKTAPDGSKVSFAAQTLFSNSAIKGLGVDKTTKTTSSLLSVSTSNVEPNVESITASSEAIGNIIGAAVATGAKGVVK